MDIALMNKRIKIQKNSEVTDAIGNHKLTWSDYFECYCTAGGESTSANGNETEDAGQTVENTQYTFTVRWCSETSVVTENGYRVIFDGEIYNIIAVNPQYYKRKSLKLLCRKSRR